MEVTRNTRVDELIDRYPDVIKIFLDFGLSGIACGDAFWGTIEDLARYKNLPEEKLQKLIDEINKMISKKEG